MYEAFEVFDNRGAGRDTRRVHGLQRPVRAFPLWPGLVVAAIVATVYLSVAGGGAFRFGPSIFPYHILVADAWLHGQLHLREEALQAQDVAFLEGLRARTEARYRANDVELTERRWQRLLAEMSSTPARHDLIRHEGREYGYWGPMVGALLLPYVAVAGLGASDVLVACLLGAGTVLAFFLLLRELASRGDVPVTLPTALTLCGVLGLGTVQFYLAVTGWVWHLSQIAATGLLTLAAWLALRATSARGQLTSGVAFAASFLARHSILLVLPFFVLAFFARERDWRATVRALAVFALPLALAAVIQLSFNHARFGDMFENGVRIMVDTGANPRFRSDYASYGLLSLHYLPHNAFHYFLNFELPRHPGGDLTFDPEGNSMFMVTPPLLLALLAWRQRNVVVAGAAAAVAAGLAALLTFIGTGWYNFGNRYLLELLPMFLVLVAAGVKGRLNVPLAALAGLSLCVNAWGTWRFLVQQP